MVKFWVVFALIVAVIGTLSNCDADATHSPYNFHVNVGSNSNGERGSGVEKTETRQVGAFSRIHAQGIGVLTVHSGIITIALGSIYYTSHKQEGS